MSNPFKVGDKVRYKKPSSSNHIKVIERLGSIWHENNDTTVTYESGGWDQVDSLELVERQVDVTESFCALSLKISDQEAKIQGLEAEITRLKTGVKNYKTTSEYWFKLYTEALDENSRLQIKLNRITAILED